MLFGEGCRSGFAATSAMIPRWVAAEPLLRNFRQRTLLGESPSAVQVKTIAGARLRDWRKKEAQILRHELSRSRALLHVAVLAS